MRLLRKRLASQAVRFAHALRAIISVIRYSHIADGLLVMVDPDDVVHRMSK